MQPSWKILLLSLALCCLSSPSLSAAKVREPYSLLRNRLIEQGWAPRITNQRFDEVILEKEFGDAENMLNAGFVEIEYCSGTSLNSCKFNFQRKMSCLTIITQGEFNVLHHSPKVVRKTIEPCS